jgi:hypothetical protein
MEGDELLIERVGFEFLDDLTFMVEQRILHDDLSVVQLIWCIDEVFQDIEQGNQHSEYNIDQRVGDLFLIVSIIEIQEHQKQ